MHGLTLVYGPRMQKAEFLKVRRALRCKKLAYFAMESPLDKPALASDCGSDVSTGAERIASGIGIVVSVTA